MSLESLETSFLRFSNLFYFIFFLLSLFVCRTLNLLLFLCYLLKKKRKKKIREKTERTRSGRVYEDYPCEWQREMETAAAGPLETLAIKAALGPVADEQEWIRLLETAG